MKSMQQVLVLEEVAHVVHVEVEDVAGSDGSTNTMLPPPLLALPPQPVTTLSTMRTSISGSVSLAMMAQAQPGHAAADDEQVGGRTVPRVLECGHHTTSGQ